MEHPGRFILFDKCLGKTCPDCGRIRKLRKIQVVYEESTKPGMEGRCLRDCERCDGMFVCFYNGVCENCFFEIQKDKNSCFCPLTKAKHDKSYYCTFCEDYHGLYRWVVCKDCDKKLEKIHEWKISGGKEKRKIGLKVGFLSGFGGIIIGFFLGWLILVKLRRKHIKNSKKHAKN